MQDRWCVSRFTMILDLIIFIVAAVILILALSGGQFTGIVAGLVIAGGQFTGIVAGLVIAGVVLFFGIRRPKAKA